MIVFSVYIYIMNSHTRRNLDELHKLITQSQNGEIRLFNYLNRKGISKEETEDVIGKINIYVRERGNMFKQVKDVLGNTPCQPMPQFRYLFFKQQDRNDWANFREMQIWVNNQNIAPQCYFWTNTQNTQPHWRKHHLVDKLKSGNINDLYHSTTNRTYKQWIAVKLPRNYSLGDFQSIVLYNRYQCGRWTEHCAQRAGGWQMHIYNDRWGLVHQYPKIRQRWGTYSSVYRFDGPGIIKYNRGYSNGESTKQIINHRTRSVRNGVKQYSSNNKFDMKGVYACKNRQLLNREEWLNKQKKNITKKLEFLLPIEMNTQKDVDINTYYFKNYGALANVMKYVFFLLLGLNILYGIDKFSPVKIPSIAINLVILVFSTLMSILIFRAYLDHSNRSDYNYDKYDFSNDKAKNFDEIEVDDDDIGGNDIEGNNDSTEMVKDKNGCKLELCKNNECCPDGMFYNEVQAKCIPKVDDMDVLLK